MKVDVELRIEMLQVIRGSLLDVMVPTQQIVFYDAGANVLCNLPFNDLVATGVGDEYQFISADVNPNILRGTAILSGTVDSFTIDGYIGASVKNALTGSVGSLSSSSDLRFNRLDWNSGAIITLENLTISIAQGA
jgi:hypothetical protein